MSESTSNEPTNPQQRRRHREPLPVTIATKVPVLQEAKKLPTDLGPKDLRLELTLKLTGQQKVFADENVCTQLPDALTPMARGALMDSIKKAIEWAVRNATFKVNKEIPEPESDRQDKAESGAARTRDEYPSLVPPGACHEDWPTTLGDAKTMNGVSPAAGAKPGTNPN